MSIFLGIAVCKTIMSKEGEKKWEEPSHRIIIGLGNA
jgi:hypothetical protein